MTYRFVHSRPGLLCLLIALGAPIRAQEVVVDVVGDRDSGVYACGETAAFTITVRRGEERITEGELACRLTLDGGRELAASTMNVGDANRLTGSLDQPGVLQAAVTWSLGDQKQTGRGGAAFDYERIAPATAVPEDFDAFWTAQKALLAEVPLDARLEERPDLSNDRRAVYKISLANIDGSRVYGWLAVPRGEGPHPAVLTVPWAGVYPTPLGLVEWASQGFLAMAVSAHDYDVDLPEERYKELDAGVLKGYPFQGRESREACYYRRVFLGCVRAIDYLVARPDWDGKAMIVNGSSQGGGLSIITAGLDARVTALSANVPALCDHWGADAGRSPGWPRLVSGDAAARATAPYYDGVCFASRVRCPAVVGVGLIDTVCCPSSVFAAYHELAGSKQIVITPRMGHSQSREFSDLSARFIREMGGL